MIFYMKYIFLIIFSILSIFGVGAQEWSGQWTIYPTVGSKYEKIIDTKSKVYFLNSASLYSYDKNTEETYFYNTSNKLSDSNIKTIYYNDQAKYLVVVYTNNSIDLIYDDGKYYCLPEIKDANISDDKTINDIAFGNGFFVVATNFGIVIYDDKKHEVKQSGNYRTSIESVAVCGDNILIYSAYRLFTAKITDRLNTINNFKHIHNLNTDRIIEISDNKLAWRDYNSGNLMLCDVDFDLNECYDKLTNYSVSSPPEKCKNGFYIKYSSNILLFDKEGKITDEINLNDVLSEATAGIYEGKSSVWFGSSNGVANFDMSSSTPVILSDWHKPESGSCREVAYFYMSPDGERIYAGNLGPTISRSYLPHLSSGGDGLGVAQTTDVIENGKIKDVSLKEASATSGIVAQSQKANNDKRMYGGVTRLAEDPLNSDTYYIGNGIEGLYVVKDGKEVWKFNVANTPFESYWETRVFDVNFDPQGNLWVGHAHATQGYPAYIVLPSSKLHKGFDKIAKTDWKQPNLKDFSAFNKDFISLFCKKSNYAFFINSTSFKGFTVLDTKGTYDNFSDDKCYNINTIYDQDGNSLQPQYYYAMAEDSQGRVWLGTKQGIFYINAFSGIDDNTSVVRPKVPRNDGTNYADYLLDSDQINSIAVDPSNRKWIATDMSGVYLVSENGDKIINHFDTSNSPLPSNRVTAVACDPYSNMVYFGTMDGLLSYKSDSSPAKEDFSEIYAYPNPVRPDYTGWITIAGLMDNSLVKITDSAGNVLYQGKSEGGMLTWDGCNNAGERVRSGVYYVYASSAADVQNSTGAVTKIMVIN